MLKVLLVRFARFGENFQFRLDGPAGHGMFVRGLDKEGTETSMKWTTVVTTTKRAEPTLAETIDSLVTAGFKWPIVCADGHVELPDRGCYYVGHDDKTGAYPNYQRAISLALCQSPPADFIMACQDDILMARGAKRWMESQIASWGDTSQVGFWSLYVPMVNIRRYSGGEFNEREKREQGFWWQIYGEDLPRRTYGALAFVWPRKSAEAFVERAPRKRDKSKVDYRCGEFCRNEGLQVWMPRKSLVEHTGRTSTVHGDVPWDEHRHAVEYVKDVTELMDGESNGEV